jgi:hypothetical protein
MHVHELEARFPTKFLIYQAGPNIETPVCMYNFHAFARSLKSTMKNASVDPAFVTSGRVDHHNVTMPVLGIPFSMISNCDSTGHVMPTRTLTMDFPASD